MVELEHPNIESTPEALSPKPLLQVRNLRKFFPIERGILRRVVGHVRAVDDISFDIAQGETLGLVGETGSGKTTLGRCILRAIEPDEGEILMHIDGDVVDVMKLNRSELRAIRRNMQMVFQDPYSSLNPRKTVLDIVGEPLRLHKLAKGRVLEERVRELVKTVGLSIRHMNRYPHAFSGGQRQRIGVARALSLHPKLIVCDEPVSALDVSVQAQILNLLKDLQKQFELTYLFIAHDLSVVKHISDRIAVMYVGQIVELATTDRLYSNPKHPYTEALLSAVPKPDPDQPLQEIVLKGEIANPAAPPSGCYFHPRCNYNDGQRCMEEKPAFREIEPGHFVRCHYAETLSLQGIR